MCLCICAVASLVRTRHVKPESQFGQLAYMLTAKVSVFLPSVWCPFKFYLIFLLIPPRIIFLCLSLSLSLCLFVSFPPSLVSFEFLSVGAAQPCPISVCDFEVFTCRNVMRDFIEICQGSHGNFPIVRVYVCLYGPFNCISFHEFSQQLSIFSFCSCGLSSALLVLSTIHLFMTVSFSPDIIPSG